MSLKFNLLEKQLAAVKSQTTENKADTSDGLRKSSVKGILFNGIDLGDMKW